MACRSLFWRAILATKIPEWSSYTTAIWRAISRPKRSARARPASGLRRRVTWWRSMAKFQFQPITPAQQFAELQTIYTECIAELDPNDPRDWKRLRALQPILLPQRSGAHRLPTKEREQRQAVQIEGRAIKKRDGETAAVAFLQDQLRAISARRVIRTPGSAKRMLEAKKPR